MKIKFYLLRISSILDDLSLQLKNDQTRLNQSKLPPDKVLYLQTELHKREQNINNIKQELFNILEEFEQIYNEGYNKGYLKKQKEVDEDLGINISRSYTDKEAFRAAWNAKRREDFKW